MADVKKIIQDIESKDLSSTNKQQAAFAEMIKGLAFSDDPLANKFMKKVDKAITKIAKDVLSKEESFSKFITISKSVHIPESNIILTKGDKIRIIEQDKWIQKAVKHPGALSKALGIPEEENIPAALLNAIINAETGETISNPTKVGKSSIKVTTELKRMANLARTLKGI